MAGWSRRRRPPWRRYHAVEIGDWHPFAGNTNGSFVGLVPSEHSSGWLAQPGLDHQDRQCTLPQVAIDGTKIAANASIDANRGRDWFAQQAGELTAQAAVVDAAEDAAAAGGGLVRGDRVPVGLRDRSGRLQRIRRAAAELAAQDKQRQDAEAEREAAVVERLRRSEAGQPVVGRIPNDPPRIGMGSSARRPRARGR